MMKEDLRRREVRVCDIDPEKHRLEKLVSGYGAFVGQLGMQR